MDKFDKETLNRLLIKHKLREENGGGFLNTDIIDKFFENYDLMKEN